MNNLKFMFTILLSVCVLMGSVSSAKSKVAIVVNKGVFGSIEKAAYSEESVNFWDANYVDDDACTESFAALELKTFLLKCTNLMENDIIISSDFKPADADYTFLIGSMRSSLPIQNYSSKLDDPNFTTDDSYRIVTIIDANSTICIIQGSTRIGALYGVYDYLQRLGITFYGPKDHEITYPTTSSSLISDINVIEKPGFITRGYHTNDRGPGHEKFYLWMARNRMNLWAADQNEVHLLAKYGIKLSGGRHSIQADYLNPNAEYPYNHKNFSYNTKPVDPYNVSPEFKGDTNADGKLSYCEAHPEWYGMQNGIRNSKKVLKDYGGDNICTANPDAMAEFSKNLIHEIIDGQLKYADIVYFWPIDCGNWCECPKCQQAGSPSDRLLQVLYTINKYVQQARASGQLKRKIQINSLVYQETLPPLTKPLPDDFDYTNCSLTFFPIRRCYAHPVADLNCIEINKPIINKYLQWTNSSSYYKGAMFIGEYYNVSYFKSMPMVLTRILSVDMPWYYEHGARNFHYMHVLTDKYGTWTLHEFLLSRLLWNVHTDTTSLLNKFFITYYPTTNKTMRKFYSYTEAAFSNVAAWKAPVDSNSSDFGKRSSSLVKRLADPNSELFELEHLQYDNQCTGANCASSMVQMIDSLALARKEIDKALYYCTDSKEKLRLLEAEQRYTYGEAMCKFYYLIVRTTIFDRQGDLVLAANEFQKLRYVALQLAAIKDVVNVSNKDANSSDGLTATRLLDVYNKLKNKYSPLD